MPQRLPWNDYFAFDSHVSTWCFFFFWGCVLWIYVYFGNSLICIPLSNVRSGKVVSMFAPFFFFVVAEFPCLHLGLSFQCRKSIIIMPL